MFAKARLKELDEAKRLVVVQSDIHRGLFRFETAALYGRFANLRSARARITASRPLLVAAAAVAGVLATRHWRTLAQWAPSVLTGWRWFRRLAGK